MRSDSNAQEQTFLPVGPASTSKVVAALRAATADRHRSIDRCMPLSRPNPQLTDYVDHLCIMRTWLDPLERWLSASSAPVPTSPSRVLQTSLIDADLAEAGMFHMRAHEGAATSDWPAHATKPYQWGARYVIEGSRLGASVLYHRLADALRPHKLRYLQGAIGTSPDRWPKFLRALRASVQMPTDINEACKGACASFDALVAICALEVKPHER